MTDSFVVHLGEKVLRGHSVTYDEALTLIGIPQHDIMLVAAYANKIREHFAGNRIDMCGVINARSGLCTEDCKFCAQSVFHNTNISSYDLLDASQLLEKARDAEALGAKRVSIVTSGKGMESSPTFSSIIEAIQVIQKKTRLSVCANLGTITLQQAQALASVGVKRYAHNIETSERFYPSICSTHPFSERVATLRAAKAAGMELCTGGIIGMGESWQDRISMAFTLKEHDVRSIPLNILNPIRGTALEKVCPPNPLEIILTFALFRFILPDKVIRPAGGREINLRDMQGAALLAGANGLIVGNYLTFTGRDAAMDFVMAKDAGMTPE
ncbi:biotin synthase [Anaerosporomusa subterranea]|uniref:Biotin synthase n=1 Tax=Anaerosporomusa subterranea TaxID=1794912 RepID=A0A154BLS9_ANASB|nr:biotin synthase BioB [Anaerosporomusa subterranea]KYZ74937.1 biotin synthase [Anaerosporomusa subterranea]